MVHCVLCILCFCCTFYPVRNQKKQPVYPDVAWTTNYGTITQQGQNFYIGDSDTWVVIGQFRPDGKAWLYWDEREYGRSAIGVYELRDSQLFGWWGWTQDVEFGPDGELRILHMEMLDPDEEPRIYLFRDIIYKRNQ